MLSLTVYVWEFQSNALWDTHQHAILSALLLVDFRDVRAGGRNGKNSPDEAYNGTSNRQYYFRTPIEMFGKNNNIVTV